MLNQNDKVVTSGKEKGHGEGIGWTKTQRETSAAMQTLLCFLVSQTFLLFLFTLPRSFVMATTEMESGSTESRSEQGSLDPDSKYPLKVLYCGGTINKLNLSRNLDGL